MDPSLSFSLQSTLLERALATGLRETISLGNFWSDSELRANILGLKLKHLYVCVPHLRVLTPCLDMSFLERKGEFTVSLLNLQKLGLCVYSSWFRKEKIKTKLSHISCYSLNKRHGPQNEQGDGVTDGIINPRYLKLLIHMNRCGRALCNCGLQQDLNPWRKLEALL